MESQQAHATSSAGAVDADLGDRGWRLPPVYVTSFIGRQAELSEITDLLGDRRLLTIAGAGGCGKTRLAREALVAVADRWPDGVRWVELGGVTDLERVAEVVAAAAGVLVDPSGGPRRALVGQLRDRRLALCLDNCEHLLDACADVVGAVVGSCPGVTVLTTSREPLGVSGETVWRVPSMVEQEAMVLFAERARVARPSYATGAAEEDAVRTVCRRLDGIPLAVELAAAWVRMLTPWQISVALDDRFRFLRTGTRGVIPRQQTLAASVGWSYDLLRDDARTLLRRLAVFSGSFSLEAAEAVCSDVRLAAGDVLGALERLVDASMVNVEEHGSLARYRLLETVREYAGRQLEENGETATIRDRHLDHVLELGEAAAEALEHDDQDVVLADLEVEHDNLRAALDWGLAVPEPDRGRRLAAALARLWFLHGHAHEGIQRLQRAIELAPEDRSNLQGRLFSGLSLLGMPGGRPDLVDEAARRAIEIGGANGDDWTLARAFATWSYVFFYVDFARSEEVARTAQQHAATAGEVFSADLALAWEAVSLTLRAHHGEAAELARTLYERCWPRHDRFCAAFARLVEQHAALFGGDVRRAVKLGTEAVRIAGPLNDYLVRGTTMTNLAWAMGLAGDLKGARRRMAQVIRSFEDAGPDVDVINMGIVAGRLQLWSGDLEAAARWNEQAARDAAAGADNWVAARGLAGLARALRHLGRGDEATEHAQRAVEMARRLEAPDVAAEALDDLACLAAGDDPARAGALYHEALQLRTEHRLWTFVPDCLDGLARIAVAQERFNEAVRLLAASAAARDEVGYPRPKIDQPGVDTATDLARAALGDDGFADAWSEGSSLRPEEAAAYAARSRGRRDRPSVGWASLTPTEGEVVALVAEGLTNPEIGQRLFISRATVKTHLSHVYAKLGVANRAELASRATFQRRSEG